MSKRKWLTLILSVILLASLCACPLFVDPINECYDDWQKCGEPTPYPTKPVWNTPWTPPK